MNKFEDKRNTKEESSVHWQYCERYKLPYITIFPGNKKYDQVDYNITDLPYNLEETSAKIKEMYKSYIEFFDIPYIEVVGCFDQYYFFGFKVLKSHSEFVANQLFDYLLSD